MKVKRLDPLSHDAPDLSRFIWSRIHFLRNIFDGKFPRGLLGPASGMAASMTRRF